MVPMCFLKTEINTKVLLQLSLGNLNLDVVLLLLQTFVIFGQNGQVQNY